jgi:hypothetical protein
MLTLAATHPADDRMVLAAPSIVVLLCALIVVVAVMALAYLQYRRSQKLEPTAELTPGPDETA